ncbi:MAG: (2,3-dihydroxybenzoyl)adenylate synthase [Bacillus sp. (in: firmicutes)]
MLEGCTPWPENIAVLYRNLRCWQGETFTRFFTDRAMLYKDKTAIVEGERRISYAELHERSERLAAGFKRLGIKKQDRIVVQLPNKIEFFEVCFALFRLGALPVFSLPLHRQAEISYFCEFTEAVAYIIPDKHDGFDYRNLARKVAANGVSVPHVVVVGEAEEFTGISSLYDEPIEGMPEIEPDDYAFFQLSGGSTGLPKLIPRTHDEYIYSIRRSTEICCLNEETVYLGVLPVAHNFPMSSPGVFGVLYAGGKIVLSPNSSPDEAFPLIEKERVNFTSLVPPLALIWLDAKEKRNCNLSSLEVLQVGGAKFNAEAARRVGPTFGCKLQQVFGMAEGLVNYTRLDDPEDLVVRTQGRPMSAYDEIRVVDEEDREVRRGESGQLLTRGPYTIRGYYKAEEHNKKAFTTDGFYRTGDIVRITDDKYIVVEGRDKDQINRGGEKIAAEEVENHLLAHESVHDAAIVAMPDDFLGERTCAFIIAKEKEIKGIELKSFLKERGIAPFKIPDRFEFVDAFPYTALGKVSKKTLRKIIADKFKNRQPIKS